MCVVHFADQEHATTSECFVTIDGRVLLVHNMGIDINMLGSFREPVHFWEEHSEIGVLIIKVLSSLFNGYYSWEISNIRSFVGG